MGALPPVFIEFLGSATGFMATSRMVKTELAEVEATGGGKMAKLSAISKAALLGVGVAAGIAAVKTVHMAADFQTAMTRVQTGAGESAKNMGLVSSGVLKMAGQVGESTKDLTAGLYTVESAGYHGSDALKVLQVSAMGAKVGAADLATVTDAVTTAMNAYKLKASDTTDVMNALVGTEAEGKTNMEALAGSMQGILPVSAAAHVGLHEVLGAMATMTAQGTPAAVAATYLRQTIGQLSNASPKAAATMKGLGLNAVSVAKELGSKGLAATLTTLTDAIKNKMGPSGTVLISTLQKAAKNGKDFQSALNRTSGSQKTYIGALATMVGGTKSMMGALQLTGPHMDTFKKNVQGVADHVKKGGKQVEGWRDVQKTFNQRMSEFKGTAEAIGISIGNKLLPYAMKFMTALTHTLTFLAAHGTELKIFSGLLLAVATGMAVASIASWDFNDSLLADPLTWIVVGIIALIAGITELIVHWKSVAAWLTGVWHSVVKGLGDAWHWLVSETMGAWHSIENGIKSAWHSVVSFFSSTWHMVTDPIVHGWQMLWKFTSSIWNGITGFFKKWWPLLLVIFLPFVALIMSIWNHFHKQIMSVVNTVWNAITSFLGGVWDGIKTAAGVVWDAIKLLIIQPMEDMWSGLKGLWNIVSGWLSTEWNGIASVASYAWGLIKTYMIKPLMDAWHAITSTMGQIKDTISNKLHDAWNEVKSVGSWFLSIGSAIVHGIINGVENAAGGLFDSLKGLANSALKSAKHFLGINSPSRVFRDQVGMSIGEGLAHGVTKSAPMVHAAIGQTADDMVSHFKSKLDINSPSKVFRQLGIWVHQGLADGLTGSQAKVKSAIKRTETLLMQTYNKVADLKGHKGVSNHWVASHERAIKSLESYVNREGAQLERLAKQRDNVANQLKSAQAKLKNLQKDWTSERDNIASGIMQNASVVMSAQADGVPLTAGDVLANMQNQAQAAMRFSDELAALKKRGLRADLIEQIASAGVDQGGATAQALLNANSDQIKQLNSAQSQMTNSAKRTGGVVADAMYKAGIESANGLIKGLQSKEKSIEKQMTKIAQAMAKAIKKELGIKSPSRVFHDIGRWVTAGLVHGVDSGERDVREAAARMSNALQRGTEAPTLSGSAIGSTAAAVVHQVHIEVHGSVRSDQDLRDVIQREMYRYGGRNSVTWQQFKR